MLNPDSLATIQQALSDASFDGWLLYDFHGNNPIAVGVLGLHGMMTRRLFAYIPRSGVPTAITHNIEQGPWRDWPAAWCKKRYSTWRALEQELGALVAGKRVAMEYSPGDAVPYVDRIPAGVLDMVRAAGASVVSSADLVSRFYAIWSPEGAASHLRAAEVIATIARGAITAAGESARTGSPMMEHELQQWILDRFANAGVETVDPPIVAIGPNAADAHYGPSAKRPVPIASGSALLIDLWAKEPNGIYADQTWMGSMGTPSPQLVEVWTTVRDARDAAIALVEQRVGAGKPVRGGEVDDAARQVISGRGYGEQFIHRTGHSIDSRDLHGSGPHIDNFETREERMLIPGVAFSIEPGVYLPDVLGVRSEVNVLIREGEAVVTPRDYQRELIVA